MGIEVNGIGNRPRERGITGGYTITYGSGRGPQALPQRRQIPWVRRVSNTIERNVSAEVQEYFSVTYPSSTTA